MKPSIPKGTRDFLPEQAIKRQFIFETARNVFQKYGFQPIETPAMENMETLMGKYGEEGDRLIFKILNSGEYVDQSELLKSIKNKDYLKDIDQKIELNPITLTPQISEKALRYDLTVPFARFVVQNQNELYFPFKRYQIQPVWRADRPQKGRYREFYQCDVDVIGSDSLLNELELIQIVNEVFSNLKLESVTIKLNNRKILSGLAEVADVADKLIDMTVAIDKLDKIGLEGVKKEMLSKNISEVSFNKIKPLLEIQGNSIDKLDALKKIFEKSEIGLKGIEEVNYLLNQSTQLGLSNIEFDITLARGLNYYTGAIFEVVTNDFPSSICGGGRYDDLTGIFGLPNMSGVGVSFGADRIYDVMLQRNLFPQNTSNSTQVLFVNFGEKESLYCLGLLKKMREAGINAELFPDSSKMKKQMKYADSKQIPYVCLIGDNEIASGMITVKDMLSGKQSEFTLSELISKLTLK